MSNVATKIAENWNKYKIIYYRLFGIGMMLGWFALAILSIWQTVLFFQSSARGTLATIAFWAGVAMDFGQYAFPVVAEMKKQMGEKYRIFQFAMILCFTMSIITSVGVDLNESNYIKNNKGSTVLQTQEGKTQSKTIDAKSSEAALIQKQLDTKLNSYDSDKKAIQDKYADRLAIAQKKNYITTPDQNGYIVSVVGLKAKITSEIKELDDAIATLRAELKVANDGAIAENDKLNTMANAILPTEGAESFIAAIMKFTKTKDREKADIIFWIIKEFIYQFFAILFSRGFYILLFCKSKNNLSPTSPDGKPRKKIGDLLDEFKGKITDLMERKKQKDGLVTNEMQNVIQFPKKKVDKNEEVKNRRNHKLRPLQVFSSKKSKYKLSKFDEDCKTYVEEMEKMQTNDISPGYQAIAKNLRKTDETWTDGRARSVFEHLRKIGMLKFVDGEGTKIIRKKKTRVK